MLRWVTENLSTIIICTILLAVIAFIVASLIRNKRKGKSSCGCGCKECAMSGNCHSKK